MRIVIATGIYPPDIGGPALYAKGVKESLEQEGHRAPVVLFGTLRKLPSGLRHVLYTLKLLWAARGCDAIFAFDTYSVGVPSVAVGMLLGIPVVVRIGGDFVWESYVERTENLVPLPDFYRTLPRLSLKERTAFFFVRWMLRHAELAFNTRWLLDIWQPVYRFAPERAHVVRNVIGERIDGGGSDRTMLLYGRAIALKNAPAFRRSFARARKRGLDLALEERMVSHLELLERIKRAHAVVLPSVSDVAPNTILDSLRCGKPFLLTKYSGYAEEYKEYGIIVDPLDEESMAQGMEQLADDTIYRALCERISRFDKTRSYDDVSHDFLEILKKTSQAAEPIAGGEAIRVLQIGADRSKRGILFPGSAGFARQEAYAENFGALDIIGLSFKRDAAQPAESGALHVYPTNSSTRLSYLFDALRIAKAIPPPRVVSVQDPFEVGCIGWLIARYFHAPLHVQVHTDFLSAEYTKNPLDHLRRLLARFVLSRASRIRVVSERIKTSLETCFHVHMPITVLPIFVDIVQCKSLSVPGELATKFERYKTKLLVVARLEKEKNVRLALASFAQAAPQDACLIVVGDGREREQLALFAQELKISGRVFLEGERDARAYYAVADLVLVPSRYEGYGLVIVEALAAGKPVLATDVGVAREAGAIVSAPGQFAQSLKDWFERGPRTGELKNYPYRGFDDYVQAYCDDIVACVKK